MVNNYNYYPSIGFNIQQLIFDMKDNYPLDIK